MASLPTAERTHALVSGAVLTGGRSRRFGRDKALEPVDGVAMAVRVAEALLAGGVGGPVMAIGGDRARLAAAGLDVWPDDHPGEGPLGGILTALGRARSPVVVVAACDLPWLDGDSVAVVVAALADGIDVAVARTDRLEPLLGAWRVADAAPVTAAAFAAGERAVHGALARLRVVEVAVPSASLRNVNHPGDLPR